MIISFDIDGVLANSQQAYYEMSRKKLLLFQNQYDCSPSLEEDFHDFYLRFSRLSGHITIALMDPIIPFALKYLMEEGHEVLIVSDRPKERLRVTEKWLKLKGVLYSELILPKAIGLRDKIEVIGKKGVHIHFDDHPRILNACYGQGINVVRYEHTYNRLETNSMIPSVCGWGELFLYLTRFIRRATLSFVECGKSDG